jgi:hypothetical protein
MDRDTGANIVEELELDKGDILMLNETDIPDEEVRNAIKNQYPEFAKLKNWVAEFKGTNRPGGLVNQNKYVSPTNIFDEFRTAAAAARDDDIVSNAVETTEQLAFKRIAIEVEDTDEASIWNQIADDMNLPQRLREIWREVFILSQCYVAVVWERKDYKVKGKSDNGVKKKKVYKQLTVPKGITILDPCKVVPVGNFMFNQEELVYIADKSEAPALEETLAGNNSSDLIVSQLILKKYDCSLEEERRIADITGIRSDLKRRLFVLNPENVFRITASRPQYQAFADVRLRSVFELLDMKHNLREMDRADILGNLNAILLVKKGDEKRPATQAEIQAAGAQVQNSARIPIIVSDHRIDIEIITRKTDNTLRPERYNNLDSRITSRLFQILSTGNYSSGTATDNSPGLFKIIASTMEARRDNIRDLVMDNVFDKIWEKNDKLIEEPDMCFYPRRIALDFDPHYAQYIFDLFAMNQLSHETVLAEVDISLEDEAEKKRKEDDEYSDVFDPPVAPGAAAPGGNTTGDPKVDGRLGGGNKNGGGANQDSFNPTDKKAGIPGNQTKNKKTE